MPFAYPVQDVRGCHTREVAVLIFTSTILTDAHSQGSVVKYRIAYATTAESGGVQWLEPSQTLGASPSLSIGFYSLCAHLSSMISRERNNSHLNSLPETQCNRTP